MLTESEPRASVLTVAEKTYAVWAASVTVCGAPPFTARSAGLSPLDSVRPKRSSWYEWRGSRWPTESVTPAPVGRSPFVRSADSAASSLDEPKPGRASAG